MIEFDFPHGRLQYSFRLLVVKHFDLQTALQFITLNPASILKLKGKGKIEVGSDADIIIMDQDMNIQFVIAKGEVVKSPLLKSHPTAPVTLAPDTGASWRKAKFLASTHIFLKYPHIFVA